MPLSELYRLSKRRVESNQGFEPGNDVFELVWENGQIATQGQSSRVRKDPTCNTLPSHCLPSYNPKSRDKDLVGNGTTNTTTRAGKFGTVMDSVMSEIPMSVPSDEVGLGHEDDMIQWLNYPTDASLQSDYCPEFLPELSGVTVHENSKSNIFVPNEKIACNQLFRDSNAISTNYFAPLDQRNNASKAVASSAVGGDVVRPRTGITSQLCPITSSQLCQASFSSIRSRVLETNGDNGGGVAHNAACSDSARAGSTSFPSSKTQKPDPLPPSTSANLINFSHFSRPAVLAKANSIERMSIKDKACAASGASPLKKGLVDLSGKFRREIVDLKATRAEPSAGAKHSEAAPREEASKNDANSNQIACESTTRGLQDGKKNAEPVVASSSVCSGNSVERASDELPTHVLKRKFRDAEDSECHSEDVEEESVGGVKKTALLRGSSSKRSRAAEMHNLSERRRRDRINEKMRALQELIPNCNKVDKASMLDEAIEYLKTLQLQVQIMSFGAGLCMPPMMFPQGMQHMLPHHMAHFSPMGMGIGMGMGMGMGFGMGMPDMNGSSSGYPMLQVPPLQGAHFPGPQMAGHNAALHGMGGPNMQVIGLPSQGMTMPMQRPPLVPVMGRPFMKPSMALNASVVGGSLENVEPAAQPYTASNTAVQTTGANSSMNQASTQCQATTEVFEQPSLVQSNAHVSDANASKVSASDNVNDTEPASKQILDFRYSKSDIVKDSKNIPGFGFRL